MRRGSWKLLMAGGMTRLYDVDKDPAESKDLSSDHQAVVEELEEAFQDWARDKAEPREGARTVRTRFNRDRIEWHI
ncbi:MAG: hypothetical protein F4X77_04360 [Acidobacteriia bacterium]|nr:hypothetical protein [Terriglobia bacterium]